MTANTIAATSDFELGQPVLVCRWRIARGRLPLANRHLRALLARTANGRRIPKELVAWAKQHIEWTLGQGSVEFPDGVLMVVLDEEGRAAMSVGPYVPLEDVSLANLVRRALHAQAEGVETGVAPETLWVAEGGRFAWDQGEGQAPSGTTSLVEQLARTMGFAVERSEGLIARLRSGEVVARDVFLVSDEHGVVPAREAMGEHGERMAQGYARLLARRGS